MLMTREEIRKERLEICNQLFELEKGYDSMSLEEQKSTDVKLRELGKRLEQIGQPKKKTKIEEMLSKGKNVTSTDVMILIDLGLTLKEISEKTGVSLRQVSLLNDHIKEQQLLRVAN